MHSSRIPATERRVYRIMPQLTNPVIEELERRRREGSAVQSSANGGAGPARTATGPIQHQHGGVAAAGARPAPAAPGGRIHAYDAAPERQPAPVFGAAARQHQNGATAAVPCAQPAHPAPSGLVPGQGPVLSVAMKLLKGGRFGLQCGFNQAVSDACRRLGGRFEQGPGKGRAAGKLWTFELVARAEVERALQEVPGVRVDLVGLHPLPLRMLEEIGERTDDSERWSEVPESIRSKMYDFQIEGVKFALRQGGRVLFGDEMGLGKSVQACATLAAYRDEWPALIITPTSLRDQWVESLEQWLHVPAREVVALSASRDVAQIASAHARFVVVSYDLLSKESKAMLQQGFRVVVCDEAHMIKSPTAKRTQAALPILRKANRVILLSGTPTTNRPIELYPQLQALLPKSVRSKEEYGERYCAGGRFGTFTGASHSDELHAILVAGVMIRRLKEDVTKDLPPKVRRTVELRVSDRDMAPLYPVWSQLEAVGARLKEIQARRGVSAREDATGLEMEQKRIMNQLYDMSATAKVAAVQQHLASLLAAKRKFIVFAHHQTLLNGCEAACRRAGADFIRIDGQTPADDRAEKVRRFQADANVRVAVLSIRAAGAGITLTAAALAVFAELSWTPGEHRQAEDRVHRIGQTRPVEASYLLAPKTIDDIIWETLQTKLGKVGLVLDGASNGLRVEGRGFQGDARQQSLQGFLVPSGSQPAASQPAASQPAASQPVRRVAGPAEVGQWTCGPCGTRCGEDSSSFTQCRVCSALRPGHWQCNACTLINGPGGTLCRACGTADSPPAKKARVGPPQ
ncbi:unnamed protein product [Pedinophyceae sp. YPF-701]|nr:unnamed protein product [Pedinophyceae sp. YPF-701]